MGKDLLWFPGFIFFTLLPDAIIGEQQNFFFVAVTSTAIGIGITTIALIMQPNILYGLKGVVIRNLKNDLINYEDHPVVARTEK